MLASTLLGQPFIPRIDQGQMVFGGPNPTWGQGGPALTAGLGGGLFANQPGLPSTPFSGGPTALMQTMDSQGNLTSSSGGIGSPSALMQTQGHSAAPSNAPQNSPDWSHIINFIMQKLGINMSGLGQLSQMGGQAGQIGNLFGNLGQQGNVLGPSFANSGLYSR